MQLGEPLGQAVLDFIIQSVPSTVMSCRGFDDDSLECVGAILGPQDTTPRARPWMAKDLITQDLVLVYAIMDRHAETEQHDADEA